MDYFPAPTGTKPIDIPFVGGEEYDNGEFKSYPQRKGWAERISNGDPVYTGNFSDEAVPFCQTWLFFGCLIKVFEAARVEVKTEDFIRVTDGKKFITTALLPKFIQQWRDLNQEAMDMDKCEQEHKKSGVRGSFHAVFAKQLETEMAAESTIKGILKEVERASRMCCIKESWRSWRVSGIQKPPAWSLPSDIALSILALRWTLSEAARLIYEPRAFAPGRPWWESTLLKRRFVEVGWCPNEVPSIMRDTLVDAQYYFGSLCCPRWEADHSLCTEKMCKGRRVGIDGYSTKHVSGCPGCEHFQVPDENGPLEIIKRGGTPLISWKDPEDGVDAKLSIVEYDPDSNMQYVAISHVWSDGMGNEHQNSLPRCQLSRLQKLVDQLNAIPAALDAKNIFKFIGPNNGPSKDYDSKEPVGFWMDTLCVPVRKEDYEYRKITIAKMKTIYEEAYRVLILDSWVQEIPSTSTIEEKASRLFLSNWQRRLWTCQEGVLAQALYFQFKDAPQPKSSLFDEQLKGMGSGSFQSSIAGTTLPAIPVFGLEFETLDKVPPMHEKFESVVHAIRHRTTSKSTDETICIANLLGLDPTPLLNIREGDKGENMTQAEKKMAQQATHEKRMEGLLRMVGRFPQGLIFNELPRLQTDGFRWAPASYLNQNISNSLYDQLVERNNSFVPFLEGLPVTYPGIKLESVRPHLGNSVNVVRIRRNRKLVWYNLLLEPDQDGGYPTWDPESKYAVISSVPIDHELVSEAILGILDGHEGFNGHSPSRLRYICRVRVEPLEEKKQKDAQRKWGSHLQKRAKAEDEWEDYDEDCPVLGDWLKSHQWCVI